MPIHILEINDKKYEVLRPISGDLDQAKLIFASYRNIYSGTILITNSSEEGTYYIAREIEEIEFDEIALTSKGVHTEICFGRGNAR
jgi:hypothetical protein